MRTLRKQENPVGAFFVTKAETGQALLDVLAARLRESRNNAKRILDRRGVLVNGKRVWMAHHRMAFKDTIALLDAPHRKDVPIRVLKEGPGWLVADKPYGILSLGVDSLEARLQTERDCPGLRVVHRLDRDTSGCILAAYDDAVATRLIGAFKKGEVNKTYRAIVAGRLAATEKTITRPIDGLSAVTHIRTLATSETATHIAVKLETGRTHQIRKHMAAIGHPVLGDRQYAQHVLARLDLLAIDRQMLHAASLGFPDPAGGPAIFANSPLPTDFNRCLKRFGLR